MGLHQDRDETDLTAPVVSVSLGDDALFRLGGTRRQGPARSLLLRSGDVVVLGGAARLSFHGIDRVLPGTSDLVPGGGRINLTLRRVTAPRGAALTVRQRSWVRLADGGPAAAPSRQPERSEGGPADGA